MKMSCVLRQYAGTADSVSVCVGRPSRLGWNDRKEMQFKDWLRCESAVTIYVYPTIATSAGT